MKIARTIGTVTLSRFHPAMTASNLRLVEIVDDIDRVDERPLGGDSIFVLGRSVKGSKDLVALAEGPESAQPFRPDMKPLDASIVALLDEIDLN